MRKLFWLFAVILCVDSVICFWPVHAHAQGTHIASFPSDPATCDPTRGTLYYNTTSNVVKICTATNTWTQVTSLTANSPVPANQAQGPQYNVRNYGAVGDAKSSRNCATTASSGTITSTDNPWVASDVGRKLQAVVSAVSTFGAAAGGNQNNEVTISAFNSAGSISVSPSTATQTGTGICVWYTQQEHTAMLAAYTAADVGAQKGWMPGYGPATLVRPGAVIIPPGGYVVCGTIYNDINHNPASNNVEGVSLKGGGPGVDIYIAPCFVPPNASASVGTLILAYLNQGAEFSNFSINGMNFLNTNFSAGQYLFGTLSSGRTWVHDVNITDWGTSQASGPTAAFSMSTTGGLSRIENLQVQDSPGGDRSAACLFTNAGVDIFSSFCSNHNSNFKVINSGQRTAVGPHFVLHGYQNDECGGVGESACFQLQNSTVNCLGCELLNPGGGVASVSLDTTSKLYVTDSSLFTYNVDGGNSSAVVLTGNAQLFAFASDFSGNNTSAAIAGPSTSKYIDLGGNNLFNQVAGVLTPCTTANYLTCAFSGGISPIFTLSTNATTQLGGRQIVAGTAPTFAVTGFGTSPTITIQTGSTDAAGAVTITAGTTPGSSGTFTLTFTTTISGAYGTNPPVCIFGLVNGTGSWNALAQEPIITSSATTAVSVNWADNSIALTAGQTYGFVWSCYGK